MSLKFIEWLRGPRVAESEQPEYRGDVWIKPLVKDDGNLYWNYPNQLRRALGRYEVVYIGGVEGGTVRCEADGLHYDWWPTDEVLQGNFRKIRIVLA